LTKGEQRKEGGGGSNETEKRKKQKKQYRDLGTETLGVKGQRVGCGEESGLNRKEEGLRKRGVEGSGGEGRKALDVLLPMSAATGVPKGRPSGLIVKGEEYGWDVQGYIAHPRGGETVS